MKGIGIPGLLKRVRLSVRLAPQAPSFLVCGCAGIGIRGSLRSYFLEVRILSAAPILYGEVAEWFIAPVLKTDVPLKGTGSSNLPFAAILEGCVSGLNERFAKPSDWVIPSLRSSNLLPSAKFGRLRERLKRTAWKAVGRANTSFQEFKSPTFLHFPHGEVGHWQAPPSRKRSGSVTPALAGSTPVLTAI